MSVRIVLVFCLTIFFILPVTAAKLKSNQQEYFPGTAIIVDYSIDKPNKTQPWIGIFKNSIEANATSGYSTYKYVTTKTGKMQLVAPATPGMYNLRLINNDPGKVVKSVNFEVIPVDASKASIKLNKKVFSPEENMAVSFTAPDGLPKQAWIGIFSSSIAHNAKATAGSYKSYQYMQSKSKGELIFNAPANKGIYELRMFDVESNGSEIAVLTFNVTINQNVSLKMDKLKLAPANPFAVHFSSAKEYAKTAWVGISNKPCKTSASETYSYITYHYINKRISGEMTFIAPSKSGDYYICMYPSNNSNSVASLKFNVSHSISAINFKKTLKEKGHINVYGIYFDTDSDKLKPESAFVLQEIAKMISSDKNLKLKIHGHTDNQGADTYNLKLSAQRASAVAHYLVTNHNINKNRLTTLGKGAIEPVASNSNAHGRALNRRVELIQ